MAEPNTIYKVAILKMLDLADFPLTNDQITEFFLNMNYTGYFNVQKALGELQDAGQISADVSSTSTVYTLSEDGNQTLEAFRDKLNESVIKDIIQYYKEHQLAIKQDNSVKANYYASTEGGYLVECFAIEDGMEVITLKMHVKNKNQAEAICFNFKAKYTDVYDNLMDLLVQ